jgi:CRP/FNR family transcriptional activator FtrB
MKLTIAETKLAPRSIDIYQFFNSRLTASQDPTRMRDSKFDEIRTLDLFSQMDEANFDQLIRGAYVQNFPPMVDLIQEGDFADFLYIVVEGCVELYSTWNGRETTMASLRPVSTFILAASITDGPFLKSARTINKSRIIMIPSEDVRRVFSADEVFARAVVNELAGCYRRLVKDSKNLKLRNSAERLANYILQRIDPTEDTPTLPLRVEKRKLAAFLGMTPENLSRAFKSLHTHGVRSGGAVIEVTSVEKLTDFANPSRLIDDREL